MYVCELINEKKQAVVIQILIDSLFSLFSITQYECIYLL